MQELSQLQWFSVLLCLVMAYDHLSKTVKLTQVCFLLIRIY